MLTLLLAQFKTVDPDRKPLADVAVTVRWNDQNKNPQSATLRTAEDGIAIFPTIQTALPMLPSKATFEAVHPKGPSESGEIIVGGNQAVPLREIVLKVA